MGLDNLGMMLDSRESAGNGYLDNLNFGVTASGHFAANPFDESSAGSAGNPFGSSDKSSRNNSNSSKSVTKSVTGSNSTSTLTGNHSNADQPLTNQFPPLSYADRLQNHREGRPVSSHYRVE